MIISVNMAKIISSKQYKKKCRVLNNFYVGTLRNNFRKEL